MTSEWRLEPGARGVGEVSKGHRGCWVNRLRCKSRGQKPRTLALTEGSGAGVHQGQYRSVQVAELDSCSQSRWHLAGAGHCARAILCELRNSGRRWVRERSLRTSGGFPGAPANERGVPDPSHVDTYLRLRRVPFVSGQNLRSVHSLMNSLYLLRTMADSPEEGGDSDVTVSTRLRTLPKSS